MDTLSSHEQLDMKPYGLKLSASLEPVENKSNLSVVRLTPNIFAF